MKRIRILFFTLVSLLLMSVSVAGVGADAPLPVTVVEPEVIGIPQPISPPTVDIIYVTTKTPRFTFTKVEGATKYRVEVYNIFTDAVVYEYSGKGTCESGECWLKPDIALKIYDISLKKGNYKWRVRARVGTWGEYSAYSDPFIVVSSGFNSTFDLDYNKWLTVYGTWTRVDPGYMKTKGVTGFYSSMVHKLYYGPGAVYQVRMKRKAEDSTNMVFFNAWPYHDNPQLGWWSGYSFRYTNDKEWELWKWTDNSVKYLAGGTTDAIIPYGWNTLKVWMDPADLRIHLWINGTYLTGYDDTNGVIDAGFMGFGMFEDDAAKSLLQVDWAKLYYDSWPGAVP